MHRSPAVLPAIILACLLAIPVPSQGPSFTQFGSGCAGSAGVPRLEADASSLPVLADTFRAQVSNLPDGLAIGILGLSTSSWAGMSLPLDLGFLAMPGCTLYTDLLRTTKLASVGGRATWDLPLPGEPGLLGVSFFQQVLVFDASVPGLGAVMSNAGEGVIGVTKPSPLAKIAFPPLSSLTDEDTILVRGSAFDPDGVAEVRVNGELALTSDGYANWQVRVPLVLGTNTLTVETLDALGAFDPQAAEVRVESEPLFRKFRGIVIDRAGNRALVTALAAIFAVDLGTGERSLVSNGRLGSGPDLALPSAIVVDGDRALVVDVELDAILAVDLASGDRRVISDAATGTGPALESIGGIALDGGRVLVGVGRDFGSLLAVDLATGNRSIISDFLTGSGSALGFNAGVVIDGGRALVLDYSISGSNGRILAVDLMTGDRTILSQADPNPFQRTFAPLAIAMDGARLLVTDAFIWGVLAVDLSTGERSVISGGDTGLGPGFEYPLTITADGSRALVTDYLLEVVFAVDLATGDRELFSVESGHASGPEFQSPGGLALDRNQALLPDSGLAALIGVDLATGNRRVISDASTGTGPELSSPGNVMMDGSRALVVDGRVLAVDLETGNRTEIITAPLPFFRDMALDRWGNQLVGIGTNRGFPAVFAVDLSTGVSNVFSSHHTSRGPRFEQPNQIVIDGARALITDPSLSAVFIVDLVTGDRKVLSNIYIGTGPEFAPTSIFLDGPRALLLDPSRQAIFSMDLASGDRLLLSDASTGRGPEMHNPFGLIVRGDLAYMRVQEQPLLAPAVLAVDLQTGERVVLSR